jgi:DnaJ-domain-containing protein 1
MTSLGNIRQWVLDLLPPSSASIISVMALSSYQRAAEAQAIRTCDHPDCDSGGAFRAPKSPDRLDDHYWFCLDHVREYNKSWNFFGDMSGDQIEQFQRSDVTGHRPTWRLGLNASADNNEHIKDDLGILHAAGLGGKYSETEHSLRPLPPEQRDALAELDLPPAASLDDIKTRYKELAKKHHPDLNDGDRGAEEKFKAVGKAYNHLLTCVYN